MTVIMEQAETYLSKKLLDEKVTVYVEEDTDKNNVVGRVKATGIRDVGAELVERGLAQRKDDNGEYKKEEEKAHNKKLGLWADIYQKPKKDDNVYDLKDSGAKEWEMYKLKLSGYDKFYKIGTGPNKYLVYHKSRAGKAISQYVLVGIDPHRIDILRAGDIDMVIVQPTGKQGLRFPSGKIKYFPILKVVGKNTVHGVGGELMYYK